MGFTILLHRIEPDLFIKTLYKCFIPFPNLILANNVSMQSLLLENCLLFIKKHNLLIPKLA